MIIGKSRFYYLWKKKLSYFLKRRRLFAAMRLVSLPKKKKYRILEVGCANGMDAVRFLSDVDKYEVCGVDIKPYTIEQENFRFVRADAQALPFADKSFDLVLTFGLLEHIEPMEKLCRVIAELDRVGRHQISVVPSVSTLVEPHCAALLYPLRLHEDMVRQEGPLRLNFFSDHTWAKFLGFSGCKVKLLYYLFPFIKNTVIYK